ncbi:MAG TPA: SH3 domain-containing protein [Leptospiraceae bacterium]|nr:SH3 domain-containing protein [Leptospiraceae bacterium]
MKRLFQFLQIILLTNLFLHACATESKKENSISEIKVGGYLIVTAKGGLNLRTEPSRKGKVVKLISEFFPVQILEIVPAPETIDNVTSNWYKVKSGKDIGYCFGA